MKRKFSLVMSAAMILSLIAPMTNALAEDIQTPETASTETIAASVQRCLQPSFVSAGLSM